VGRRLTWWEAPLVDEAALQILTSNARVGDGGGGSF
jgi:hypothetical protein